MKQLFVRLLGGQLQRVLIACFSLIAALTLGLSTVVTLHVITDYLDAAMERRVARDMDLANAFFQLKANEITAVAERIIKDPQVIQNLSPAIDGQSDSKLLIDQEISRKIRVPTLGGTHILLIFDREGSIVLGRTLSREGVLSPPITKGNWSQLPIVETVLASNLEKVATEIIPTELLSQINLKEQARITLVKTPKEMSEPFDPREGTAGLALTSVYPFLDAKGNVAGAVLSAYLINNDFTLVDRIRATAGVDTVTVFFGDLRVSTNVMTEQGERAVGTRLSEDVFGVVLLQGKDYVGRAFVVNDWYITRYEPLRDHLNQVVGILYVGALESTFRTLVQTFNSRIALIALVSMILAGIVAVPIARLIIRPITDLVEANRHLAQGDMRVRVQPYGTGELGELGQSFNKLAETLESTQQELLHKERLASMGQLAAGVAHEINNPLGSILLFSDMMLKETSDDDPRHHDLKMIVDETHRCKNIVADLLNFSRQQEVLAQETDVNVLINQVIEVIKNQPVFDNVELAQNLSPELPTIQADPGQLEQVLINLINNAAESMDNGGSITISSQPVAGSLIEIKVADTGCGIPEENLGKLFSPFFTTKSLGKGTGLGLSIAYGIIKMHRGQIDVQSKVGSGTTFTITLPIMMEKDVANMIEYNEETLA